MTRSPSIWVPTQDGTMLQVDPDGPQFILKADHVDTVLDLEDEIRILRTKEAAFRHSAMEASQREARWMMIERRIRDYLSKKSHADCACIACQVAKHVVFLLNSDPPVGEGFRTEDGLSLRNLDPTSVLGKLAIKCAAHDAGCSVEKVETECLENRNDRNS